MDHRENTSGVTRMLYDSLNKYKMHRKSPSWEKKACNLMGKVIRKKVKTAKRSLIIGTQSLASVVKQDKRSEIAYKDKILFDNLFLVKDIVDISDTTRMYLGNSEDKVKTTEKSKFWRSSFSKKDISEIITGPLNSETYYEQVERLMFRSDISKKHLVILVTSGSWSGNGGDYSYNTDFRTASFRLIRKYKNLHIVAMVREGRHLGFRVRHLYNNKNILIKA